MSNRDYHDPRDIAFRKAVRERDGGKCIICGSKKRVQVHHIVRYVDSEVLRYSPSNGCCLCYQHHKKVTGFENHYIEFLKRLIRLRQKNSQ